MKNKITVKGKRYLLTVLIVTGRDEDGKPRTFEAVYSDESTNVENEPSFITGYLSENGLESEGMN